MRLIMALKSYYITKRLWFEGILKFVRRYYANITQTSKARVNNLLSGLILGPIDMGMVKLPAISVTGPNLPCKAVSLHCHPYKDNLEAESNVMSGSG